MIIPPSELIAMYTQGKFPMGRSRKSKFIDIVTPHTRGIIPLDQFHVSKNVMRQIRNRPHTVRYDYDFLAVIKACAARKETWISDIIINSYELLFRYGYVHTVEVYDEDNGLAGGLYGVHLGAVFFGESMFKKKPDADKFALYYCHKKLVEGQFLLWDAQFYTPHLGTFGAIAIPQSEYLTLLKEALSQKAHFTNIILDN